MSINTPASWTVHALRTRLGTPSGPAALRGLTRLNVLLTLAMENESLQSLGAGRVGGSVLSSKQGEEGFQLVREQDVDVRDMAGFPFAIRDCL